MAPTFISRYTFFFLLFTSNVLAHSSPPFEFNFFDYKSKFLNSHITLYGDAKLHKNGSFIQLTQPLNHSFGRVIYTKPINQLGENKNNYSFGTFLSFSLSSKNGDGLIFSMLPNGFSSSGYNGKLYALSNEIIHKKNRPFFGVEIDSKNNHVGINVGSLVSLEVKNVSLRINSGVKLQCWIDYEASSKRIEVRMSKSSEQRPVFPVISYTIDLLKMFKSEEIFIGLSSFNANSTQVCKLYSWRFELRQIPYWMHSQPLDPRTVSRGAKVVAVRRRNGCGLRVVTAVIIGTACGALGAYVVMFVWSVFVTKQAVVPEEYVVKGVVYESEKVEVIAVETFGDGKK